MYRFIILTVLCVVLNFVSLTLRKECGVTVFESIELKGFGCNRESKGRLEKNA